ncbi:MAG TPA: CRISPR-associated protein Cas4 [Desulfurococcales archaeon]|nr:CRISPR-associated protein Cas4 [Desulfurococcales archaeon]
MVVDLILSREYKASNKLTRILYLREYSNFKDRLGEMTNPRVVYVTDMVSCSQKRYYRLSYPELAFSFEPVLVLGNLVHMGLEKLLEEEGYKVEVEFEKIFKINGVEFRVKGRVDAINSSEVVEIKTTRTDIKIPLEHHILQLQLYLNLLNREKGILIYITPERISEYQIDREELDVSRILLETIENTVHPRWSWECKYCTYARICPYKVLSEK